MGSEAYRMKYAYSFLGDPRQSDANLCLFYTKVSPGFEVQFPFGLQIRAGVPFLLATGGVGIYTVRSFESGVGYVTVGDYHNQFQAVRYPVIIGPKVNLGYAIKSIGRWRMAIRISGFYGVNSPVFRYSFNTPHNPFIRRISVDLGITRLGKSKE